MPPDGIEPPAFPLRAERSTTELRRQFFEKIMKDRCILNVNHVIITLMVNWFLMTLSPSMLMMPMTETTATTYPFHTL
jgi:hypothetical protein